MTLDSEILTGGVAIIRLFYQMKNSRLISDWEVFRSFRKIDSISPPSSALLTLPPHILWGQNKRGVPVDLHSMLHTDILSDSHLRTSCISKRAISASLRHPTMFFSDFRSRKTSLLVCALLYSFLLHSIYYTHPYRCVRVLYNVVEAFLLWKGGKEKYENFGDRKWGGFFHFDTRTS